MFIGDIFMNKKRTAVIILSSILILCTVFTLSSADYIVDSIIETYHNLLSALPNGSEFQDLLTADALRKYFFADIAILLIAGLVSLYYSIMDRILEKKTLLIACLIIAMLSCVDVISFLVAIANFVVILTINDDKKSKNPKNPKNPKSKSKKPTIKKLED